MNIASKEILARLLATENVTVSHQRCQTASFNVRDRVLTLPIWDNMESDTYDHLVGHEVGHALYTPEAGWHESASKRGETYRGFLNVIEDARIEKMIQARYPGLRRSFISSYKRMLADGFFGADLETINTYGLIDRINTYFKCGRSAGVRIEKSEMPWIAEIEALQTWEEVVELTDRLYDSLLGDQKEFDEKNNPLSPDSSSDDDSFMPSPDSSDDEDDQDGYENQTDGDDDSGEDTGDQEGDAGDEEGDGDADDGSDDDGEGVDGYGDGDNAGQSGNAEDSIASKTDEVLRNAIDNDFGNDSGVAYTEAKLHDEPVLDKIIGFKELHNDIMKDHQKGFELGAAAYSKFLKNNKKSINYMVKEFEMKKSAAAYSRQTVSKTGVLDSVKMNSYLYSDDIFRKVNVTQDGKNHGMIMYVDWSGSMASDMKNTIDQMMNIVHFCRQTSIPYQVFAFTDRGRYMGNFAEQAADENTLKTADGFKLIELFSDKMKRSEFLKACHLSLALGTAFTSRWAQSWQPPSILQLGGTPLDDAIVAAMKVHDMFKSRTRADVINTIFLTDGDSFPMHMGNHGDRLSDKFCSRGNYRVLTIVDPVTNKRYRCSGPRGLQTAVLLKMYRERTGSTTIGYRIVGLSRRDFMYNLPQQISWEVKETLHKELKKEKYIVLPSSTGYDRAYALAGGTNLQTANSDIEIAEGASKAVLRTAFKKANNSRKGSRKMLSDFIGMVS